MKKIFVIAILCIGLSSCSSSSTDATNTTEYSAQWFTMNVPKTWLPVESKELPSIQNGKIELALTAATEISAGFSNNLVVLSENINETTTSLKYAITNYVRTTWTVQEYTKLKEDDFKYSDNDEWKIYIFEAKYWQNTPIRKFIQTAKICNKKAYLMTIWIWVDNSDVAKYENLLKSFKCK